MTNDECFPRGQKHPTQSPLFWVQQKDRYLRQLLIRDIEAISGRRLLTFFGNRFVKGSDIQAHDIAYIAEVTGDLNKAPIDILIETNGGETDATDAIISLVKQVTCSYRVIVANAAKSNGTMFALSAEAIIMGPTSELGPIEPQFAGHPVSTLLQDHVREKEFALFVAGTQALRQSVMLAERLLRTGMMAGATEASISEVVKALTTRESYPSHGSVIDRLEASRLGLRVTFCEQGDAFWDAIWLLYCMLDWDCRKSGFAKIFEGRARSLAVEAAPA